MKVKLSDLQGARDAIDVIMNTILPFKVSYNLAKTMKKLDSNMNDTGKAINALYKQYGTPDEKTKMYMIPEDKKEAFNKELADYLLQEVEIDAWTISVSSLMESGVKLSPAHVISLESFLVDDTVKAVTPA